MVSNPIGWAVMGEGSGKATKVTVTQKEALKIAEKLPVISNRKQKYMG